MSLVVVYRGVMLYGDSGAGKSSLINAGLVPGAIAKGFQPERIRVYPHDGGELVVERIPATDAGDTYLPSLFAPDDDTTPRIVLSTAAVEERLRASGPQRPLLVFDQFEELITLFDDREHEELQRRIAKLIVSLLRDGTVPVKLLFVFREDYLASVKQLLGAAPELVDQALRLTPPAAESLTRIIRGPFERFPGHYPRELSPSLTERLCLKLADRFGSGAMSLSEVQTVCLRLWQSDDQQPLLELRGVQGLLEDYLGEELDAFPPELKYPAAALLSGMVTSAGTRNVISAESLIGHVREEEDDIPVDVLERALDRLESQSKLVRRERRRDLYLYEITSEFLVPWISRRREELIRARERREERRKLMFLGVAVVVLLAVLAGVAFLAFWARDQRNTARHAVASEASIVLSAASTGLNSGQSDTALLLGLAAVEESQNADPIFRVDARVAAIQALESARQVARPTVLRPYADRSSHLAMSSDGSTLASYADVKREIRLWDLRTHAFIGAIRSDPEAAALASDGRMLAVVQRDGSTRLWNVRPLRQLDVSIAAGRNPTAVAFSPSGSVLATGRADGTLRLWNTRTGKPLGPLMYGHRGDALTLAFSPNGRILASGGKDATARLWSVRSATELGRPIRGHGMVTGLAFTSDGTELAIGDSEGKLRLVTVQTESQIGRGMTGGLFLDALTFSPDGKTLASGGEGGTRLWNVQTQKPFDLTIVDPFAAVYGLAFSADGKQLIGEGPGGSATIWDVSTLGRLGIPVVTSRKAIDDVAFSPDGKTLAVAGADGTVRLVNVRTGEQLDPPLTGNKGRVWGIAFSPNGRLLAGGGQDSTVRIWNLRTHKQVAKLTDSKKLVWSVAFSPDGRLLAAGGKDKKIRIWRVSTGTLVGKPLTGHTDDINWLAFSPNGEILASASSDNTVRLWDVAGRSLTGPVIKVGQPVNTVVFSPDGRTLAVGGIAPDISLWSVSTHKQLRPGFAGSEGTVFQAAFSPDGRTLAATGDDGVVRLWDVRTRRPLGPPLDSDSDWLYSITFSPDGHTLATGGNDGTARLWPGFLFGWKKKEVAYAQKTICTLVGGKTLTKAQWAKSAPGIHAMNHPVCPQSP